MKITHSFRGWFAARRTMNQLHSLSNQMLSDIGLSRNDIRLIAQKHR